MKILKIFLLFLITILLTITTQNSVKIGEKNLLAAQSSENVRKIFFSDFDEIWRGNSQKYGDSKYQKKFSKFLFFGPFFHSVHERTPVRTKYFGKIFHLQKK